MAKKQQPKTVSTKAAVKRLIAQSAELNRLTTLPGITALSSKRRDKLVAQADKVEKAVGKIGKILE